jgi:excisionase family DNA binding protein
MNRATIYGSIDSGKLPAIRVGARRVRIRKSDFEALTAAGEMQAVADSNPAHAQQWKEARAAAKAASDAARLRDKAALCEAAEALSKAAAHIGEL